MARSAAFLLPALLLTASAPRLVHSGPPPIPATSGEGIRPASVSPHTVQSFFDFSGVWHPVTPPRLAGHALAYDPSRDRLIAGLGFSGELAVFSAHVYEKPLGPPGPWSRAGVLEDAPYGAWPGRSGVAFLQQPLADRTYLFGGVLGAGDPDGRIIATNEILEIRFEDDIRIARVPQGDGPAPQARASSALMYDAKRERLLVFGGSATRPEGSAILFPQVDLWEFDLAGDGGWRELIAEGTPPSLSVGKDAVYDSHEDRILVVSFDGRLWQLPLAGRLEWQEMEVGGDPPSGTGYRQIDALYEPGRRTAFCRVSSAPQAIWRLNLFASPPHWTRHEIPGGGPPPNASLVLDEQGDRILAHGGTEYEVPAFGTWSLQLNLRESWRSLDPVGAYPSPMRWRSAEWDPSRQAFLCVGTRTPYGAERAVEAWWIGGEGTLHWRKIREVNSAPDVLFSPTVASAFDATRSALLFFARDVVDGSTRVVRFTLSNQGGTWEEAEVLGTGPREVPWLAALEDEPNGRVLVFAAGPAGLEVWSLWLEGALQWQRLEIGSPYSGLRTGASVVYDPVGRRAIVIGGTDGTTRTGDVWALSLDGGFEWSRLPDAAPVHGAAAIYNPVQERVVLLPGSTDDHLGGLRLSYLSIGEAPIWTSEELWLFVGYPISFEDWPCPRVSVPAAYHPILDAMLVLGDYLEFVGSPDCNGAAMNTSWYYLWNEADREVRADVDPGNAQNPIPLGSNKAIALALFDTPAETPHGTPVEVAKIDPATVRLAGAAVRRDKQGEPEAWRRDVDKDGTLDLLLQFDAEELQLAPGTEIAEVTAETYAGARLHGADRIRLVGHAGGNGRRDGGLSPTAETAPEMPRELALRPAGFAGSQIRFTAELPVGGSATIELYDVAGRRLHVEDYAHLAAGTHALSVHPRSALPIGVYLARIRIAGAESTTKVLRLR